MIIYKYRNIYNNIRHNIYITLSMLLSPIHLNTYILFYDKYQKNYNDDEQKTNIQDIIYLKYYLIFL